MDELIKFFYKAPIWKYKIRTDAGIKTGEFDGTLEASEVCKWLEDTDAEVLSIKRLEPQTKIAYQVPPQPFNVAAALV